MRSLIAALRRRLASGPKATSPSAAFSARPFRSGSGLETGAAELRDLRDRFCAHPWDRFEVGGGGKTYVCCPKWLPTPIGDAGREDASAIWNSKASQAIRRSILDGDFRYCVQQECPLIQSDRLPRRDEVEDPRLRRIIDEEITATDEMPLEFYFCYDESCNLQCPSCRRERVLFTTGKGYDRRRAIQDRLVESLFSEPHDRSFRVHVTGSGDPFGSKLFRELLTSLDGRDFPNVVFDLQTNGVLFTRDNWARLHRLHANIGDVAVSFDAATPETYAYTRRGGDWEQLLENVAFLCELRKAGSIERLRLDFVVQQRNYREMPAFVRLAESFGAIDTASFSLITDWGTYPRAEFAEHAIWRPDHPEFDEFLEVLRDPDLERRFVFLGNLSAYREKALAIGRS